MGGGNKPHQTEDTAFIKETQRRESRSINKFVNEIPVKMPKDHKSQTESNVTHAAPAAPPPPAKPAAPAPPAAKAAPAPATPAPKPAPAPPVDPTLYPRGDVEVTRMNDLSMKLWKRVNAGYLIPYRRLETDYTAHFKYNDKLIGKTDRSFMHKRDMFSEYVEYAARMEGMLMKKKPLDKPLSRPKPKAAPKPAPAPAPAT